jgi:hypothetical protein
MRRANSLITLSQTAMSLGAGATPAVLAQRPGGPNSAAYWRWVAQQQYRQSVAAQQALARQRWIDHQRWVARQWAAQQLAAQQALAQQQAYNQGVMAAQGQELAERMMQPSVPQDATPPESRYRVTLTNPAATAMPVNFFIDGRLNQLGPGESRVYSVGSSSVISFDRWGGTSQAVYSLPEGAYQFVVTRRGWDLRRAARPSDAESEANVANSVPESSTGRDD